MYKYGQIGASLNTNGKCLSRKELNEAKIDIVENNDGTVSLFYRSNGKPLVIHERTECCELLGYNFDLDSQKCMWTNNCENDGFKILLNPVSNTNVLFDIDEGNACSLDISFDYLFDFKCSDINYLNEGELNIESSEESILIANNNSKIKEKERLLELIEIEESYNIPYVLNCNETNESFCLTEEGLVAWALFLGDKNYKTWVNSLGSDTNVYSCNDLKSFIESEPSNEEWLLNNCGFTIYDKIESVNKINNYNNQINEIKIDDVNDIAVSENPETTCDTYLSIFESLDISFNLEKLNKSTNKLETIYNETILNIGEGNLSTYVLENTNSSGFLINGDCDSIKSNIINELIEQYINNNDNPSEEVLNNLSGWFNSCWLNYNTNISDQTIINQIINEEINISIKVNGNCVNFSILIDNVVLNKDCQKIDNEFTFISEPPKFEIKKVLDNKKSWLGNDSVTEREFDLKYRETEYITKDKRLTLNTKEIDLNLSPARAVEQDLWCYISDNNCILESCDTLPKSELYSCPYGFNFDGDDNLVCVMSSFTETVKVGNTYLIDGNYNFNRVNHYGLRGTIFVDNDVNDLDWPIYWSGTPENQWVGPYYNVDYLTDSSGYVINSTSFGVEYGQGNILRWSSPEAFSGFYSQFGSSESPTVNNVPNPNLLWGGTPGLNSMVLAGRLFNSAIWVKDTGVNNQYFDNKWLGISECININETAIYNLGFAADDKIRIKINGKWLINPDITPYRPIGVNSGFDTFRENSRFTQTYVVLPIKLFKGKNVIEIEGFNGTAGAPAGFVTELYSATTNELKSMVTEAELDSVTIFSTKDFIGKEFDVVGSEGYFCPSNYALDTCLPEPYQCLKIDRVDSIENDTTSCCCPGDKIIVRDYSGENIELPQEETVDIDCEDLGSINREFRDARSKEFYFNDNYFNFNLESNCNEVYSLNEGTLEPLPNTNFNFWVSLENDSSVGLYKVSYDDDLSVQQIDKIKQTNPECCLSLNNVFNSTIDTPGTYKLFSWDDNLNKCVYNKCGDDGCINIDTLLTTEVTEFNNLEEFSETLSSELIDVKNRQTITSYPTIKMLYDRYNNNSLNFCDVESSNFDYFDMDDFGKKVGNYWVDLIEQVIPATTLWNSTYEYRNTIIDQQKFKYKNNNIFICNNPSDNYPFNELSNSNGYADVEVVYEILDDNEINTKTSCQGLWIMENTSSPNYLGTVTELNGIKIVKV